MKFIGIIDDHVTPKTNADNEISFTLATIGGGKSMLVIYEITEREKQNDNSKKIDADRV